MPSGKTQKSRVFGIVVVWTLKIVATALVIAIPVLAMWAGSSLAAYSNGPMWAAILAGLALFPLLPLAWDGLTEWRRRRREARTKKTQRPRILTFWDRLIVRTFVLSTTFLLLFVATAPSTIFTALSTRGDWMLDGQHGETSEAVRGHLLATADALEFLYEATEDNPFAEWEDDQDTLPTPAPNPGTEVVEVDDLPDDDGDDDSGAVATDDSGSSTGDEPEADEPAEPRDTRRRTWPFRNTLHPAIAAMHADDRRSIDTVARYVVANEQDPYLRVKALHDFVADHVAYDAPSYVRGDYPPQDAETVFHTGKGVCAGYSRLMVALGDAAGIEIVYVVGNTRDRDTDVNGASHAWNAVEIEGKWYLMDVTWDAGSVEGSTFTKGYEAEFLLTPPHVFGLSHFPEQSEWQLRETPITRGEFHRQPKLRPRFYAHGFRLLEPDRSQVTVQGRVRILLENRQVQHVLATFRPKESTGSGTDCRVSGSRRVEVVCTFPRSDVYDVLLFDSRVQYGRYQHVGSLEVVSR